MAAVIGMNFVMDTVRPEASAPDAASVTSAGAERPPTARATVVIASSRLAQRRRLAAALRRRELAVVAQKSSAARALGAVLRRRPRLCLLDADLDGNLITTVRGIAGEHPQLVIVILVDKDSERRGARALRAGADAVIRDRGDSAQVATEVAALLERHTARASEIIGGSRGAAISPRRGSPPPLRFTAEPPAEPG